MGIFLSHGCPDDLEDLVFEKYVCRKAVHENYSGGG
jgi:hypothetical protein